MLPSGCSASNPILVRPNATGKAATGDFQHSEGVRSKSGKTLASNSFFLGFVVESCGVQTLPDIIGELIIWLTLGQPSLRD
jgi:hypothetical protein